MTRPYLSHLTPQVRDPVSVIQPTPLLSTHIARGWVVRAGVDIRAGHQQDLRHLRMPPLGTTAANMKSSNNTKSMKIRSPSAAFGPFFYFYGRFDDLRAVLKPARPRRARRRLRPLVKRARVGAARHQGLRSGTVAAPTCQVQGRAAGAV